LEAFKMALIKLAKKGYGQLELNFAAFRRNGAVEAQCKMADGIEYLENGMLLAVDRKNRVVGYPTGAENELIALNYTTEHMYDEREKGLKNFKLDKDTFFPRLGYMSTGDKFTTNAVELGSYANAEAVKTALTSGKVFAGVHASGYIGLTGEAPAKGPVLQVIKVTTMPDGQAALKFQVVKA
jgi:hypothetical protein